MTIKQLSIFLENRGGTLIRILDILSQAHIQIIASTIADTNDYGLYRILCDQPEQAYLILKEAGINVQLTDVIALSVDDTPGCAAQQIKVLSDAGINILYLYSFLWEGKGVLVLRVEQHDKAREIISIHKIPALTGLEFKK